MRGLMSRGPVKPALVALVLAAVAVTAWLLFVVGREGPLVDTEPAPQEFNFPVKIPPPPGPLALDVVIADLVGDDGDWEAAKERLLSQGEVGLAKIKELLANPDYLVLEFAIDVLADSPAEHALPLLKPFLDHPDPIIRVSSSRALYRQGDWSGILLMSYNLRSEDVVARRVAAGHLAEVGTCAIPVLIRALSDPAWQVRHAALRSLREIGEPSVVPALKGVMENDEKRGVRVEAAAALYELSKSDQALRLLLVESRASEWPVRVIAAFGLTHAATAGNEEALTRLVELLADENQSVRYFVIGGLSEFSADDFGYDYERGPKEQQEAVTRWRAWLQARKERSGQ